MTGSDGPPRAMPLLVVLSSGCSLMVDGRCRGARGRNSCGGPGGRRRLGGPGGL